MIIGQILIDEKIKVDKNIELITDFSEIDVNTPTLIVGLKKAKEYNPMLNFMEKCFGDNVCWTVKKKEKRDVFEEDYYNFIKLCYVSNVSNYNYVFIDFILFSDDKLKSVFTHIKNNNSVLFIKDDMIYILTNKSIFGIDINQVKYVEKNEKLFLKKIRSITSDEIIDDKRIKKYNKILDYFNYQYKYIPVIHKLNV